MEKTIPDNLSLTASQEDYLEAVFELQDHSNGAHCKDIASRLGVKMPSATAALRGLAAKDLIVYRPYEPITLTDAGHKVAENVVKRHRILSRFFSQVLGADANKANQVACQMEHAIGTEMLDRFTNFLAFVEECPRAGIQWIKGCGQHDPEHRDNDQCERCIRLCLDKLNAN